MTNTLSSLHQMITVTMTQITTSRKRQQHLHCISYWPDITFKPPPHNTIVFVKYAQKKMPTKHFENKSGNIVCHIFTFFFHLIRHTVQCPQKHKCKVQNVVVKQVVPTDVFDIDVSINRLHCKTKQSFYLALHLFICKTD